MQKQQERSYLEELFEPYYKEKRQEILLSFNQAYPDDESCWLALVMHMQEAGLLYCRKCNSSIVEIRSDHRVFCCKVCNKKGSTTAGSFFHGVKKLRAWFFAIWVLEKNFYVSSKWLGQTLEISQSSALHILKSSLYLIEDSMAIPECKIFSIQQFRLFFNKRSLLTPARKKPEEEAEITEETDSKRKSQAGRNKTKKSDTESKGKDDTANSTINKIIACLGKENCTLDELTKRTKLKGSTVLSALTELEYDGKIAASSGGKYTISPPQRIVSQPQSSSIEQALKATAGDRRRKSIHDSFVLFEMISSEIVRGFSRKYIGLYIGLCNRLASRSLKDSFLETCILSRYIGSRRLYKYESQETLGFVLTRSELASRTHKRA
ncbi:MAG: hypothetical protein J0M35_13335 [Candidatus Obscuribacter phosphatis]|uniref:DprA winged helix domain-containing protein n=1 Tax=Candidatus Obscuribacter phosphatis TaxID=1906157 RepID=A0A8J7TM59_9BACT|nr:hypothetical protein [Candidatus Obscuribacter phosphatis]